MDRVHRRPSPRYVALLVSAAILVLGAGASLRPDTRQAAVVVPSNELATLPERSQRRSLREMAEYVAERANAVGASVVYLPALGASGLIVGSDSVLSVHPFSRSSGSAASSATLHFLLTASPAGDSARPAAREITVDTLPPRWALVVARAADGRALALAGLIGGLVEVRCGDFTLRELVFDTAVPLAFGGGGVFDLDGNTMALAVPCGTRAALVPLPDISRALDQQRSVEYQLWIRYGFRVAPADSVTSPGKSNGLTVREVLVGGAADLAGLRPGDLIGLPGARLAARAQELDYLLAAPAGNALALRRVANRLVLNAVPDTGFQPGVVLDQPRPEPGLTLMGVLPDSRAARAGFRAGDRILQIGRDRQPTPAALRRALAGAASIFVVYERDGRLVGLVLK